MPSNTRPATQPVVNTRPPDQARRTELNKVPSVSRSVETSRASEARAVRNAPQSTTQNDGTIRTAHKEGGGYTVRNPKTGMTSVYDRDGKVRQTFNANTGTSVFNRRDGGTTVTKVNGAGHNIVTRSYSDGTRISRNTVTGTTRYTSGSRTVNVSRVENGYYTRNYSRGTTVVYNRTYVNYYHPAYGYVGFYTPGFWGGVYPTYFGPSYGYYNYYFNPWYTPYVWSANIWWGSSYYGWGWYNHPWALGFYSPIVSYPSLSWWMADFLTASLLNSYAESQREDRAARAAAQAEAQLAQQRLDAASDQAEIARLRAEVDSKNQIVREYQAAAEATKAMAANPKASNQENVKLSEADQEYLNKQIAAQVADAVKNITAEKPEPLDATKLMDKGNIFMVHEPMTTKITVDGEELQCALSEGDYVQKVKETKPVVIDSQDDEGKPTKETFISATVIKAKKGSCKNSSIVTINLKDLQEMTNDFVANVESSAKEAHEKKITENALQGRK